MLRDPRGDGDPVRLVAVFGQGVEGDDGGVIPVERQQVEVGVEGVRLEEPAQHHHESTFDGRRFVDTGGELDRQIGRSSAFGHLGDLASGLLQVMDRSRQLVIEGAERLGRWPGRAPQARAALAAETVR